MRFPLVFVIASGIVAKNCQKIVVPIQISAENAVFNINTPKTEIDVINLLLNTGQQGASYAASIMTGKTQVGGDYTLAATYCEPENGPGGFIQIMTHGLAFGQNYWDFPFDNYKYSYVNKALVAGYSTLTYDRLGVGGSSRGNPLSELQVFLGIEALRALTIKTQQGQLPGVNHAYSRTVHIGHSFGSRTTFGFSNMYPSLSSGVILTGYNQVSNFSANFALGGNFAPVQSLPQFANESFPIGYVASKTTIGTHIDFFAPNSFDPAILEAAFEAAQPVTVGEMLTGGFIRGANQFRGPVMIITGSRDLPFCGGDCLNTANFNSSAPNLIESSRPNFAAASVFNVTIVPGAGHGLNLGYSAGSAYDVMLDFLNEQL